jgi:PAS domain S-box-containing protein
MAKMGAEQLRMIVESAFAARMLVSAADDRIVYVNRAAEEMFGLSAEEIVRGGVDMLLPLGVRSFHQQLREAYYRNPSRVMIGLDRDIHAVRKNGSEFPVHVGLAPVHDASDALFIAVTIFDISHHKEIERQLVERAHELELANDRLARFAHIASHDVQEPLRKIAAFADLMTAALARNDLEEAAHASRVVRSSALRARELVDGLLAYSRQVATPPRRQTVDLRDAIETVISDFSELIRQTEAQVIVDIARGVTIEADKSQFESCVANLLSNAIKYRKPDHRPRVTFSVSDGTELRLSVTDDGIGFEPKYEEAIFEPLKRLHSSSRYPGVGVGLALCKSTCERHGWRIEADSQLGAGATFTLTIPRDPRPRG